MNRISVIEGDALVELSSLNDESVDLIIADPPYNLGKDYGNNNDRKSKDEYLEFSYKWLSQAKRFLVLMGHYMYSWDLSIYRTYTIF